jgi:hypothetical protein
MQVTFGGAFAAQLFAGHSRNKSFEIHAREILADVPEPVRQILVDSILSALTALGIGIGRAQQTLGGCANSLP